MCGYGHITQAALHTFVLSTASFGGKMLKRLLILSGLLVARATIISEFESGGFWTAFLIDGDDVER
ncbi:MAG: hypothetical protein ACXV3D_07765 [Halobacteriota archaeon]